MRLVFLQKDQQLRDKKNYIFIDPNLNLQTLNVAVSSRSHQQLTNATHLRIRYFFTCAKHSQTPTSS